MPASFILHNSSLATSWLHEAPGLASAFTHLFLLNVFPYGDVFTSPTAELNGPGADLAAQAYRAHAFSPPELLDVAAPDHLGLQLAFLDHLAARDDAPALARALASLLTWAPAACLAVQREPDVHPFFAELAQATQRALFGQAAGRDLPPLGLAPPASGPLPDPEGEVRLRDLAAFFLAPARCGLWLSRGRLGRIASGLGLALPFGPRAEVAAALFAAAGSAGQFDALLDALTAELSVWNRECTAWPPAFAAPWLNRHEETAHQLGLMRAATTSANVDH